MDNTKATSGAVEPYLLDTRPIFERGGTPCSAVDDAVKRLEPGQSLVLMVPFEPVPLYTKLGQLGFGARPEELPDGTWRVEFCPSADTAASKPTLEVPPCACSGAF
jgi:uncharacterized protein (DUF2249 family)